MRRSAALDALAEPAATRVGSAARIRLDEHGLAWLVEEDDVDILATHVRADGTLLARRVIGTAHPGDVLLGARVTTPDGGVVALAGIARGRARVRRLAIFGMRRLGLAPGASKDLAAALERWLALMGAAAASPAPHERVTLLEVGTTAPLESGSVVVPRAPMSLRVEAGACALAGHADLSIRAESGPVPLPPGLWLAAAEHSRVAGVDLVASLRADEDWRGVREMHRLCLGAWLRAVEAESAAERQRVRDRVATDERTVAEAVRGLAAVLGGGASAAGAARVTTDPLIAAVETAARAIGVEGRLPPVRADARPAAEALESLARHLRLRVRRVALRDRWWERAIGAMIAIAPDERSATALVPRPAGGYDAVDAAGTRTRVDAGVAASLPLFAHLLYRPLPDRPLGVRDLAAFAFGDSRRDLRRLLLLGLAGGAVGTAVPVATSYLIDEIIPAGAASQLVLVLVTLVAAAISGAVFNFTGTIAVLRMQGRAESMVQSAVWSRLLELPVRFFRQYSAADLAERAMSITAMRQTLSDAAVAGLLGLLFAAVSALLLLVYDARLALIAFGLVALLAAATLGLAAVQVRYQRRQFALGGKIDGLVFHLLSGIAKLRVARAEGRAFAVWSRLFATRRALELRSGLVAGWLEAFTATFAVLATTGVLVGVASTAGERMSPGAAVAFLSAFASLVSSAVLVSQAVASLLRMVPLYERAAPILQTVPEIARAKAPPGTLGGALEVRHLRFRYRVGGPLALDDVSFAVPAGSFVAVVGPSGSGKSTLFRLLLGFDEPEEGDVFFDGRPLGELDVQLVRRQIGAVLQSGRLFSGDLFRNIVGALPLNPADAWEAARRAGIADEIEAMPMKMFTVVSEGGGNLSGGQRQRILIARALAASPRILFFDEATSALDNRTQSIVSSSIDAMRITRLVIAHRLSTIRHADTILVLDEGRLAEQGTYDELMARGGVFARLAARQTA